MSKAHDNGTKPEKLGSRDKRLAAALRENLRRRKAQLRRRSAAGPERGLARKDAEA